MKDKFYQWLSFRLPKKLVLFCAIRLMAFVTDGKYSDTIVPELSGMDALKRWED